MPPGSGCCCWLLAKPLQLPQLGGWKLGSGGRSWGQVFPTSSLGRHMTSLDGSGWRRRTGISSNTFSDRATCSVNTSRVAPTKGAAFTGV